MWRHEAVKAETSEDRDEPKPLSQFRHIRGKLDERGLVEMEKLLAIIEPHWTRFGGMSSWFARLVFGIVQIRFCKGVDEGLDGGLLFFGLF